MARLKLSKSSLSREQSSLKTYQQFLPSLDMKRQELMRERAKAARQLQTTETEIQQFRAEIGEQLIMLSNHAVDLDALVVVNGVHLSEENIMGAHLPVIDSIDIKIRDYSFLAKPHWVDPVSKKLKKMMVLKIRHQVEQQCLTLLEHILRKITQRVNLFDKVLIPKTQKNIQRIRIYLSDAERAAVINAKLAKKKRARGGAI